MINLVREGGGVCVVGAGQEDCCSGSCRGD